MVKKIKSNWAFIKEVFCEFLNDNCLKLSAALSYYTIFSIAPMLFIVISLAGIFYGQDAVQGRLFWQIEELIGKNAAVQIQEMIANTHLKNNSLSGTIIGLIILLFGATGVFTEIQDSINYILSIKTKPTKGWLKFLLNKVLSFSLVVGLGFVLLISLVVNTLMDLLSNRLAQLFSNATFYIFYIINISIIYLVITFFFTIIYKVLPDATIHWKDAIKGALFTAILFLVGKFLIGYYLSTSTASMAYGTAASLVIILLWIYYTSIILYFGAEFTKVYAYKKGRGIIPHKNAVFIIKEEKKQMPFSTHQTIVEVS